MKKNRLTGYLIGAVLVIIGIAIMISYNGLVKKEEQVKRTWAEVQNAYQRRLDLIPNLVNIVKGGADYEKNTLEKVTEARSKTGTVNLSSNDIKAVTESQNEVSASLNRLFISVENYPDLKGTKAFLGLQTQLEGTERRVKVARKDFNEAIQMYNSSVRTFPTKLVAGIFGFDAKESFNSVAGADKVVEVKF